MIAARVGTWSLLALLVALGWAGQVAPASRGAAWGSVLLGALLVAGLLHAGPRASGRARLMLTAGAAVAAVVLGFATSGIPLRLLLPDAWGDLASGVVQGIGALPGARVPYAGVDEWTRGVIVLGGTLLVLLSAVLAGRPQRVPGRAGHRTGAAMLLGLGYAVPIVERSPERPFLSGAVFAVLLAAFLWIDRLPRGQLRLGAGLVGASVVAALVIAPVVEGEEPLFDYEQLVADSLQTGGTTAFDWSHDYGPLDWPRDGREVLRIRAREGTYWKATVLADFDGTAWVRSGAYNPQEVDSELAADRAFRQTIDVVVRNMTSEEYVTAGTTVDILDSPRLRLPAGSGTWRTGSRPLRRGDGYRARVYVPRPAAQILRDAGTDYPDFTRRYLTMRLPQGAPSSPEAYGRRPELLFPRWGEGEQIYALFRRGLPTLDGQERILASPYARTYRLARRLRAASRTPYDFVRQVRARVMRDATYTETPAQRAVPLDAFLFDTREGYCQQFSGAMALLLRMGGVPARIASGFTSGSFSERRGEWVVRDLDAHSWVEAYFPGQGWVAFDPTPEIAPPRAQLADEEEDPAATEEEDPREEAAADAGDRNTGAGLGEQDAVASGTGGSFPAGPVLALLALAALVALGLGARQRRSGGPGEDPADPWLAELLRALRRTGRDPRPGTTLAALEHVLRDDPDAAGYVRGARLRRYGPATADDGPTRAQRRALRRFLGDGLGPAGRLRAWWALPPRAPRPGRRSRGGRDGPRARVV